MRYLWIDFVNSDARDYLGHGQHQDHLEDPDWMRKLLHRFGLAPVDLRSDRARGRLRQLRTLIQRLALRLTRGEPIDEADLRRLNRSLSTHPAVGRVERDGATYALRLASTARGLDALLFEITASFASFLEKADPTRLKTCENPDCVWLFYDTSRSRTRRWCADGCGNLIKVRRFRQRQRSSGK
jgi:predicted RNA-binding Zn ribbon-like protein